MNTLNEIRIKLTDFGRLFLRKDATINVAALINTTAKDILTLLDQSSAPDIWKPRHGEQYLTIQGNGTITVQKYRKYKATFHLSPRRVDRRNCTSSPPQLRP